MAVISFPAVNASSSSTGKSYSYDPNVPFKKRFKFTEDLPEKRKPSICEEDDEEDDFSQKVETFFEYMRKKFAPKNVVGLATKRATKICPPLYIEDGENKQNKKRKMPVKKVKRGPVVISSDMNERLERFITSDEMNGSDLKLVIQKRLFMSDLKGDQNRLNMPIKQLQTLEFLKPEEKAIIEKNEGIKVGLVGPTLKMYKEQMVLKKWYMLHTGNYVLMNNWNHFVHDYKNDLKVDTMIQVWSFRRNLKELCFALVIVGDEETMLDDLQSSYRLRFMIMHFV